MRVQKFPVLIEGVLGLKGLVGARIEGNKFGIWPLLPLCGMSAAYFVITVTMVIVLCSV